ncbi:GGDEF domain-containing protein [Thiohalobacter sp. IOR34]|uniref:GGDEF domain-containing protein n=1 Tax=Thiohalobacter sp. IOR34 TaxID=3057176 RepID=UPI0025AFDCD2|nr:GGDEF domain-containing protein [Thiohalobacter sp. IOR34]WJW74375.1 GGDEF domain-containing protein [Thiohalobacter sp. IOR34]
MGDQTRRRSDRRRHRDRRAPGDRRAAWDEATHMRYPGWQEQVVQFLTRYLFVTLGVLYFNFTSGIQPAWLTPAQLNLAYALYFLINTANFIHASGKHICPTRFRFAMWVDIAITGISVLNDPYDIPPSLLVFIMVVLGNGMRYGLRLFGEALVGSFAAVMLVFTLRYLNADNPITPGMLFLNLFGGIILVYAYILMGRIEESHRQLEHKSKIDTLTGLTNRRGLLEITSQLFERLQRDNMKFVVMFADLDKFKAINDTYGHAVGDEVLKAFAGILQGTVRDSDIAARIGGDEFVLILHDTSLDEAENAARRIQQQVAADTRQGGLNYSVTIGLGEAPTHGSDFDALLHHVDKAMYRSKSALRGGEPMESESG